MKIYVFELWKVECKRQGREGGTAELFGVQVPDISKHLANIYDEGKLDKETTVSKMEIVQKEGNRNVRRKPDFDKEVKKMLIAEKTEI